MKLMPECQVKYQQPRRIGVGGEGLIYRVSHDQVAKVRWSGLYGPLLNQDAYDYYSGHLRHEDYITRILHENGFPVPKPEGIFNFKFRGRNVPCFVMGYLPFPSLNELSLSERKKSTILCQVHQELERAKKIGICPATDGAGVANVLLDKKTDNFYLIDFSMWSTKKSPRNPGPELFF